MHGTVTGSGLLEARQDWSNCSPSCLPSRHILEACAVPQAKLQYSKLLLTTPGDSMQLCQERSGENLQNGFKSRSWLQPPHPNPDHMVS